MFSEREGRRLLAIGKEVESLNGRIAGLQQRVVAELGNAAEVIGGAEEALPTLEVIAGYGLESFTSNLLGHAVKRRAAIRMAAAQTEFEQMRELAQVPRPAQTEL
jgi:hypothetical protein